ncbi:MAG: CRISPR-associated protein Cas4 [Clostridiales bacterium]|nr:CRISPR-associated protein Cas4 [Clostridiales bacterium]
MNDDREYLPLSLLSQAGYCLRRAALILNERIWEESADTAKGRAEHEKVHTQRIEHRGKQLKLYEYPVFSEKLGLNGKCDCIEAEASEAGCKIPSVDFPVELYPVEYKHGLVRQEEEYEIQLCAQAMCLEEMYEAEIREGAIFYITSHKRQIFPLTPELRKKVKETADILRKIRENYDIPYAKYSPKCKRCSIREYCLPKTKQSALNYCLQLERDAREEASL